MPDSKRFDTGEVEIAYSEWAGASPPVVSIHGISTRRAENLVSQRGGQRAFAYDARGHGASARTPGSYTFVNFGRDAIAFLRGVVREPAILVGHSLGGMTAIYAAAHAPELVRAAFLVDPPLYAPGQPLRDEKGPFSSMAAEAGKPIPELVATGMPLPRAESVSQLDGGVMHMVLDGSAFQGWDTDDYLRRSRCPIVLEHGDRDLGSAIYAGELERATALIANCTVLHLDGTGHVPWYQQPERFDAELSRFIQQHARG